jgi:hypothetical protein
MLLASVVLASSVTAVSHSLAVSRVNSRKWSCATNHRHGFTYVDASSGTSGGSGKYLRRFADDASAHGDFEVKAALGIDKAEEAVSHVHRTIPSRIASNRS